MATTTTLFLLFNILLSIKLLELRGSLLKHWRIDIFSFGIDTLLILDNLWYSLIYVGIVTFAILANSTVWLIVIAFLLDSLIYVGIVTLLLASLTVQLIVIYFLWDLLHWLFFIF